jgi:tetratricopeptide (TPR) repeat protein
MFRASLSLPAFSLLFAVSATCLAGAQGPAPAPAPGSAPPGPRGAEARRAELDRAFAALKDAPDAAGAALVEARIRQLWSQAITPSVTLLLNRGVRNLQASQAEDALEDFDAAVTLGAEVPEAWHLRAQAEARLGDLAAAARDLQETLRLEPRHWAALLTWSTLQQQAGDNAGALRSLDAALAINPKMQGGVARREELRRKVEGQAT